jgi:excisionase family DNA binding protein
MRVKTYSTFDIARMLEIVPGTAANWVDNGRLKAFTTLGGHRRVSRENLLGFLKENSMPVPELLAQASRKKRILVVEDDEALLKLILNALKKLKGCEVFKATDGFQAGQIVEGRRPDLVILDIMLPDINGFKVCERIKDKNKNIRVIAITGYDAEEVKKKILDAGADAYLIKPFQFKTLFGHVERLCGVKPGKRSRRAP